ncbi:hypothetical protein ACHQM5_008768 [Ranunculus cassubicifolius]
MALPQQNRHIPCEILSNIFSKLPLEDIIRCSAVSTYWFQSVKHLHLPSNNMHCTKSEVLDILLSNDTAFNGDRLRVKGSMHLISSNQRGTDGKSKHKEIPVQKNLEGSVVGSCNGLLCIAHFGGTPYAIYNPITEDTRNAKKLRS